MVTEGEVVEMCAVIRQFMPTACPFNGQFSIGLEPNSITAGEQYILINKHPCDKPILSPSDSFTDYVSPAATLTFEACDRMSCTLLPTMTDCDVEGSEVFEVGMARRPGLFGRIRLTESVATVTINDSICKSI